MIGWVAKRHFGVDSFDELVPHKFLTPGRVKRLADGQAFLWRVRYALHTLTGHREERILFDHQIKLAEMLGYDDPANFSRKVKGTPGFIVPTGSTRPTGRAPAGLFAKGDAEMISPPLLRPE